MTPTKVNLFDKYSILHHKWLIKIKYDNAIGSIYVLWLTDFLDKEEDKMLTNSRGQIVGARNPSTLIKYILTTKHKLFDTRQTKAWARKVKEIKPRPAATYDLIQINSLRKKIDQEGLEEISNFINLYTDLITTTKEEKLEQLRRKKDIKAVWEYFYDNVFWPRFNDPEQFKNSKVKSFTVTLKLKVTLKKMTEDLVKRIEILQ